MRFMALSPDPQRKAFVVALVGLLLVSIALAGCQRVIGVIEATETPVPTRTRRPTPVATQTTLPTLAPTLPPTVTPLPTADTRIQDTFAPDVNPLTGEKVSDPTTLNRRPLAIKVSNFPPQVRPQRGLGQADLVFQHILEGVTRLTAVFYSQTPELVGSVRSARYLDLEIVQMYKSFFAYSGSSGGIRLKIQGAPWFNRVISPDFGVPETGVPFVRVPEAGKAYEHTLFAKPAQLYKWAQDHGLDNSRQDLRGLSFSDLPIGPAKPAVTVTLPYAWRSTHPSEIVSWKYNAASGRYLRWVDGVQQVDANNNQPISAANIIIVYTPHVTDCMIQEDVVGNDPDCNVPGHFSIQIQIWGNGSPAQIIRDGKVLNGRWVRARPEDMLTFVGDDGKPLPLKRGNSWFQMVTLETRVQIEP